MTITAQQLREIRDMAICLDKIVLTVGADSPLLLASKIQTDILTPSSDVTKPVPLTKRTKLVQAVVLAAGPREDGASQNVGIIFVGGQSATLVGAGFPLIPTATVGMDSVDLKDVFFVATDPLDRLRILFVA